LKVVTSWKGAFEAIMSRTFCLKRVTSRASRGVVSSAFQNPGLIEYEYPLWEMAAVAGPYWCQPSGWLAQVW
jgi:hypothetical protein